MFNVYMHRLIRIGQPTSARNFQIEAFKYYLKLNSIKLLIYIEIFQKCTIYFLLFVHPLTVG
jgi:hypothetical protein